MSHRESAPLSRARTVAFCLALTSTAALQSACSPDAADGTKPSSQAAATKLSISEFQMGSSLGPHGGIAQYAEKSVFSKDLPIHVAMRVRNAPQGTEIKVVWKSPAGDAMGEESKRLLPGQDFMHFTADGESLPPGAGYHAEISANGAPVTVLSFDLTR